MLPIATRNLNLKKVKSSDKFDSNFIHGFYISINNILT